MTDPSDLQRHADESAASVTGRRKRVVMVAAVADNGVIGLDGDIPWKISEDLKHFRETTRGHTVLMGRTTYDGIGHPLPYRTNVVVTRDPRDLPELWLDPSVRDLADFDLEHVKIAGYDPHPGIKAPIAV